MSSPEPCLHARVASLEQRLAAWEHEQLQLRAVARRTQRIDLNVRLILRHLKLMGVAEHQVDTALEGDQDGTR